MHDLLNVHVQVYIQEGERSPPPPPKKGEKKKKKKKEKKKKEKKKFTTWCKLQSVTHFQ